MFCNLYIFVKKKINYQSTIYLDSARIFTLDKDHSIPFFRASPLICVEIPKEHQWTLLVLQFRLAGGAIYTCGILGSALGFLSQKNVHSLADAMSSQLNSTVISIIHIYWKWIYRSRINHMAKNITWNDNKIILVTQMLSCAPMYDSPMTEKRTPPFGRLNPTIKHWILSMKLTFDKTKWSSSPWIFISALFQFQVLILCVIHTSVDQMLTTLPKS